MRKWFVGVSVAILVGAASAANAISLLGPTDPIIAIDLNFSTGSSTPGAEGVTRLIDGNINTKYLNFGETQTGFIVTPGAAGAIQSFVLTTANDAPERDPSSYELYGTNDPITSLPHLQGDSENWTLISSGALSLPATRLTAAPAVDVANVTSYSSYKMIFPTVNNSAVANSMQVAEAQFFTGLGGTGTSMLAPANAIIPIRNAPSVPSSNSPPGEAAQFAIDQTSMTKYLNFGEENSGVIISPRIGNSYVTGIRLTTANDASERDPTSYAIYGTNEDITTPNNGIGDEQNWTLISSGPVTLPLDRFTAGDLISFSNDEMFRHYRVIFPTVRNAAGANSMQIAEIELFGEVPEPSTIALLGLGLVGLAAGRRTLRR